MSEIRVRGLLPLNGEISIQGSKNAALPMMAGAVLHKGITVLTNVPDIRDVCCMMKLLELIGCRCQKKGDCLVIDARELKRCEIPSEQVRAMRSSIMLLGPLVSRLGEGISSYPGGCLIGARPIDLHLMALRTLGAQVEEAEGRIRVSVLKKEGLSGGEIFLPYPSVGATEQAVLASVLAGGVTIVRGAAREPEIAQLCHFLNNMGAVICGMGTDCLMIQGVASLKDSSFSIEGDRIAAGTYGAALMAAGGKILLKGIRPAQLRIPLEALRISGAQVRTGEREIQIESHGRPGAQDLRTEPYPGFPTDLQSPYLAFLACGRGVSHLEETVFEERFAAAESLKKMGALIRREGSRLRIRGVYPLRAAEVRAKDLRGGAALVVAALAAEGETRILDCEHIQRGYEDICRDLGALGAEVEWTKE